MSTNDPAPCPRTEPSLDELFGDPIIQLVMRRDGIDEGAVRKVLKEAAGKIGSEIWTGSEAA